MGEGKLMDEVLREIRLNVFSFEKVSNEYKEDTVFLYEVVKIIDELIKEQKEEIENSNKQIEELRKVIQMVDKDRKELYEMVKRNCGI